MKKILDEFLAKVGKNLLKVNAVEFMMYVKKEHPNLDDDQAFKFLNNIQKGKKEQAKKYEELHLRKTIRFSKEEFSIIEEQLKNAEIDNFSQWAKSVLLKKKIVIKKEQNDAKRDGRIESNLNQIARAINQAEQADKIDNAFAIEIISRLTQIQKDIGK